MKKELIADKHIKWLKDNIGLTFDEIEKMTDEETDVLFKKLLNNECDALDANSPELESICEIEDIIFDENPNVIMKEGLKVKYIGESDPLCLLNGKVYDVLSIEYDYYRIVDETGEDFLYDTELFDIVEIKHGESYVCPVCGMHTFWSAGEGEVCPICKWKDGIPLAGVHQARRAWKEQVEKSNAIHALRFLDDNLLEFVRQETGYDRSAIEKMTNDEFAGLYDQISDIEVDETPSDDSELSLRGKNAEEFITIVGNTVYRNSTLIDDE